jgi:DNA-binding beta-propeller fold protein YncE
MPLIVAAIPGAGFSLVIASPHSSIPADSIPEDGDPRKLLQQDATSVFEIPQPWSTPTSVHDAGLAPGSELTVTFVPVGVDPEGDSPAELVFTPDGASIIVAHRDSQNLVIFDAATRDVTGVIALSGSPNSLDVTPDGATVVTANLFENTASIVDLVAGTETDVVAVGTQPGVVRISPDGTRAVVGNTIDSSLSVIDIATATETSEIFGAAFGLTTSFGVWAVSYKFTDYLFTNDSQTVIFPDLFGSQVIFFDIEGGTADPVATQPNPARVVLAADGVTLAVSHSFPESRVTVIDVDTRTVSNSVATGSSGTTTPPITIDPTGTKAVVAVQNAVQVVNLVTNGVSSALSTGTPNALETTADGLYCMVGNYLGNIVSYASESIVDSTLNTTTPDYLAVSPSNPRAATAHILRNEKMEVVNTNGAGGFLEDIVPTGPPPEGDKARNVAVTADGQRAVVINNHSQNATIIDVASGMIEATVDTGVRPGGVAITPDGAKAVVANLDSTFATVIDLDSASATNVNISRRGSRVAISPDGQYAYIPVVADGDGVWRINIDTQSVAGPRIFTGNMGGIGYLFDQSSGMTLSHDGNTLVTCGSFDNNISIIDTNAWTEVARVGVGSFPTQVAFSPDDSTIFVSNRNNDTVSIVQNAGAASSLTDTVAVGDFPFVLTTNPEGTKLYVANFSGFSISVIGLPGNNVIDTIAIPPNETVGQPMGLAFSASGTELFVGATGTGLYVIDAASNVIVDTVAIAAPADLVYSDSAGCVFVPTPFGGDGLAIACQPASVAFPPLAEDSLAMACGADGECANQASCVEGRCYVPKNRYISLAPNPGNLGLETARRVGLDLGGSSEVLGWIGEPDGNSVSRVVSTPYYADWATFGDVHVGDCVVSVQQAYWVQAIAEGLDIVNEDNYSAALILPTVQTWGDVKGSGGSPPNGVANFEDIQEIVLGFQGVSSLPAVWLDLDGQVPNFALNFADIQLGVLGFQQAAYPFDAPLDCP